jgi:hypothetical protein
MKSKIRRPAASRRVVRARQVRSGRSHSSPAGPSLRRGSCKAMRGAPEQALNFVEGRYILRTWKALKTYAGAGADVTRQYRRPFGALECDPERRAGATSVSAPCTVVDSPPNAKRPTEAGKLTRTALVENKSKLPARSPARETLPEIRRGRLWGASWNGERPRASEAARLEHSSFRYIQHGRAHDIQMMGHATETHARAMLPRTNEMAPVRALSSRLEAEIRLKTCLRPCSNEHRSSPDSAASHATPWPFGSTSELTGPRAPTFRTELRHSSISSIARPPHSFDSYRQSFRTQTRPQMTRPRMTRPWTTRPRTTPARPPRKLLRVNGRGDKLGYPQASFVPPLIFSHQP